MSDISLYHLHPYEEAVGPLTELKGGEGLFTARIGRLNIVLPEEMKETLKHHIGQRIAILRTDLPDKPYLLRALSSDLNNVTMPTPATQLCEMLQ